MLKISGSTLACAVVSSLILSACGGSSSGLPMDDDPNSGLFVNPEPPESTEPVFTDPDPEVAGSPVLIDGQVQRQDVREADELFAYRPGSPYASVLKDCALIDSVDKACTLTTLPFIRQVAPAVSRSDVMDRLLVTHNWMGERFEALIDAAPDNMIPLFGSITSISIGSTIRPSNYWTGTGAIQLDPESLWLSVAEKANVSIKEDFRSGFGADLQFWAFGTLRNGDKPAFSYFNLTDTEERTLEDIKFPMYRLLYHELAHAVDYLPEASVATLDEARTPNDALNRNRRFFLSGSLVNDLPLYSNILYRLGQVSFRGEDATETQKALTPSDAGAEMANDGAIRYYAYNTTREDFATLFAISMMKFNFGHDYHIAYVQKPADEADYACTDLTVGWGSRNRMADSLVLPRVRRVFELIYGSSDEFEQFFAKDAGISVPMTPGVDWCTNRDSGNSVDSSLTGRSLQQMTPATARQAEFKQLERERLRHTH